MQCHRMGAPHCGSESFWGNKTSGDVDQSPRSPSQDACLWFGGWTVCERAKEKKVWWT